MKTALYCLVLAFALAASGKGEHPVLRTVADAQSALQSDEGLERRFILSGTVVSRGKKPANRTERHVILRDTTGYGIIRCSNAKCPPPGSLADISGKVDVGKYGERILRAEDAAVIGTGTVPPPVDVSFDQMLSGKFDYQSIRTTGFVVDVFPDEIDPRYEFIILRSGDKMMPAGIFLEGSDRAQLRNLIDAKVLVTGTCLPTAGGYRSGLDILLDIADPSSIETLSPPPVSLFDAPPLANDRRTSPRQVVGLGRRRVDGIVIAAWRGDRFMMNCDDGRNVIVTLSQKSELPSVGERVRAVGFPETDLFNVNLSNAKVRKSDLTGLQAKVQPPLDLKARQLLEDESGQPMVNFQYHGRVIRLKGVVRRVSAADGRFDLESDSHLIPVDCNSNPGILEEILVGGTLSVCGVCIVETESWRPGIVFSHVRGVTLVPRSPDDLRIISRPPWWTIERLLIVIGALVAALAGILLWNRILNRIVNRRSRELLKEQIAHTSSVLRIDERTRLAVELHDSLSQNLAAVSMQLSSARSAKAAEQPAAEERHLATAEKMLDSCRAELRLCLWDLRSDTMEESDFSEAIRKTLKAIAHGSNVTVDFRAARSHVSDSTAHAILMIIRELVSNAIRHGHARNIGITGGRRGGELAFSVQDDGCGFDVDTRPGQSEGHFGIEGIEHRVRNLNGTFSLTSAPGRGTTATVTLNLDK